MNKIKFSLTLLIFPLLILTSCSKEAEKERATRLSGDWKLISTTANTINLTHDYYLTFEDHHIYSMHNFLPVPVVDCYQKPYKIAENSVHFHHLDIPHKFKFKLSHNKDTLTLNSDNITYTYLAVDEPVNYDDHKAKTNRYLMGILDNQNIDEASGIIASKKNQGVLWTHNDSGSENRIFAMDYQGNNLMELWLENVDLVDCEDISIMEINGEFYILLADIGDNKAVRDEIALYMIPEVTVDINTSGQSISLNNISRLPIQLGSSRRDAETLITLPNNEIMIISKRERNVHVYQGSLHNILNGKIILDKINELPYYNITAGDFYNPTGTLLIKNYDYIYSLDFNDGRLNIYSGKSLDYIREPQGEALSWDLSGTGYFTVSEKKNLSSARLYYYPYRPYWMQ